MTHVQINPPFDDSAPCPACQDEVRGLSALLHNFLTRCSGEGRIRSNKAFVRLVDMRAAGLPVTLTVPHPAAQEVVDVCRELIRATDGIEDEGLTIYWTPEIRARVEALIPRAMAAADAFSPLAEAHFRDARHSSGQENLLREERGLAWPGFINPDYEAARYDHTVEVVTDGADLTHTVCGTGLKLHDHFKETLRRDPTFYGRVWCPTCRMNVRFEQFRRSDPPGPKGPSGPIGHTPVA